MLLMASLREDLTQKQLCPLGFRVVEELAGNALLYDLTTVHEHHPIRNRAGEAHLMGHHHHRHTLFCKANHDVQNFFDHLRVEGRCRFVEEHDLWTHAEAPSDCHTLLLASRELARILVGLLGDANPFEIFHGDLLRLVSTHPARPNRRKDQILYYRQMREEVELLENYADLSTDLVDMLEIVGKLYPVDYDPALLVLLKPVDATDHGRFSRPRWPTDYNALTLVDGEVDAFQHMKVAEPLVYINHLDYRPTGFCIFVYRRWRALHFT